MINKAKLVLIAAVAVLGFASSALAQSFDEDDGIGNVLPFTYRQIAPEITTHHSGVHNARRNGMNSFAMEPRHARRNGLDPYAMEPRPQSDFNSESPAATGGGSLGYNQNLYNY